MQLNALTLFCYWALFAGAAAYFALKLERVMLIAVAFVAMIAAFCAGYNVETTDEHRTMKRAIYAVGMLCCCVVPWQVPMDSHCSTCLGKDTPTRRTIDKFVKDCVLHKSANQQMLGKNNDLENHRTKDGGIARKHPQCYDDLYKVWDPCDVEAFTWISLSCMTN